MKTTIKQSIIEQTLAMAVSFTDQKDNSASCVFLSINDGMMEIEATNFGESIRLKSIPVTADGNLDRIAIDGRRILQVVKAMSSDEIILDFSDDEVVVKQGRTRFKISIMTTNAIGEIKFPKGVEIELNGTLLEGMERVSHAVDANHSNHNLGGILLDITQKAVVVVGTDTKRLAAVKYEHQAVSPLTVILPKRSVSSMNKVFGHQAIKAYVDDVNFTVETETLMYTTRTVNGKFPDWKKIVPKEAKSIIEIDSEGLKALVMQASIVSDHAQLIIKNNELTVDSEDAKNHQSMFASLGVDYEGEEIVLGINTRHVLDLLAASATESVKLYFNEATSPLLFHTETIVEVMVPVVFSPEMKAGVAA